MSSKISRFYDFGPFRIDIIERLLLRSGKVVALTPKAYETLLMLVRNNRRIVTKEELLTTVWPETFVAEATLAQNIFTLRKALGGDEDEQYIQTLPKRGYRFVANVTELTDENGKPPVDSFGTIIDDIRHDATSEEWQQLLKPSVDKAEAYQLYLKGRYFLNKRTKDGYAKAIDCFKQAIEIDPPFALAYSGLADSYILFDFYGLKSPWETMPKARTAAGRAVEFGHELAEAHTSLGAVKLVYDHDLLGAEREFKLAIRLNPKYARAHDGYAHCLIEMGQVEESFNECKVALELEPFDLEVNQHLGWYYLFNRQYDLAVEQLQKTLAMEPNFYRARILLGIAYEQKKLFSEAITEFLRAGELEKTPVVSGFLGFAYAMSGKKEAVEVLDDLLEESRDSYVPPYLIAMIYTGLGKQDEAFEWLQKAFVEHSHWRGWLRLIPEFDSLRSDPRFTKLLQRKTRIVHY